MYKHGGAPHIYRNFLFAFYRICFYSELLLTTGKYYISYKNFFLRLQEARLQVLQKILQQREDEHAEMTTKRLNKLW